MQIELNEELIQKGREKETEYHREWQRKNKEKVKEYRKRYWAKKSLESASADEKEGGEE